MQLIILIKR